MIRTVFLYSWNSLCTHERIKNVSVTAQLAYHRCDNTLSNNVLVTPSEDPNHELIHQTLRSINTSHSEKKKQTNKKD